MNMSVYWADKILHSCLFNTVDNFYTPSKYHKTLDFCMFSGGIEFSKPLSENDKKRRSSLVSILLFTEWVCENTRTRMRKSGFQLVNRMYWPDKIPILTNFVPWYWTGFVTVLQFVTLSFNRSEHIHIYNHNYIETHFISRIFASMYWPRSIYVVSTWSISHVQPHFRCH